MAALAVAPVMTGATANLPRAASAAQAAKPVFRAAGGTYTTAQTVDITDATKGAVIYYTTDGSAPTASSSEYKEPLEVRGTETVKAIAVAAGFSKSAVTEETYTIVPQAPAPRFSPAGGSFRTRQLVRILDDEAGVTIHYTLDGSAPTTSSPRYVTAIEVASSQRIRAMAVAAGRSESDVAEASFDVVQSTAAPVLSPAAGAYISAQAVHISDTTAGAVIYYSTNGTAPTTSSSVYTGPIMVSSTETVTAVAQASGDSLSPAAVATYTVTPPAAMPQFSVPAGTYKNAQTVAIIDATPNATIYYTTNGTTPTATSSVYSGAITLSSTETITAVALAIGGSVSQAASAVYTITPPAAAPLFRPGPGIYTVAQTVTLSSRTPNATMYYTVNGTVPTTASSVYSGPIAVSSTETVSAIALAPGTSLSPVTAASYTFPPAAATPIILPAAGTYNSARAVSIASQTPGAVVFYTTDGSTPTTSSNFYAGPIELSGSTTVSAMAVAPGASQSAVAVAAYTITPPAAAPAFLPAAGTYTSTQTVTITSATANATIYYTTNGTTPNTSSSLYNGPITVSATETLTAIALATGAAQSAAASAAYAINVQAATPVILPAAGPYTAPQSVSIASTTANATIHYTTDGTTPTASSKTYTGSIAVTATGSVSAIATATGYSQSAVAAAAYTILTPAAMPVFMPAGGVYLTTQNVTMTAATANSVVYYTLDGSTPTTASSVYSGPIAVAASETLSAIAVAPATPQSAVSTAIYTITPQAGTPVMLPAAGTYISAQMVMLTSATANAVLYYTLDGSTPSTASNLYSGPISVSASQTVSAIATAQGDAQSAVATAAYVIAPPAAAPTFTPAAGGFTAAQSVTLSSSTPNTTIYYSTNGAAPTTASPVYSGPINVAATQTISAMALAPGYSQSPVAAAAYILEVAPQITTPATLPAGYPGAPYSASIDVFGGGPNYVWTVNGTAVPTNGSPMAMTDGLSVISFGGYALTVRGTPTAPGPLTFTVSVADNFSSLGAGPVTFTLPIDTPAPISLPPPTPSSIGAAVVGNAYMGYAGVSGGVPPYTWTVTGLTDNLTWSTSTEIATLAGDGQPGYSGDGGPATGAAISDFGGVAVDASGDIFFADAVSARVREVSAATGLISTVAGTGTSGYNGDNLPARTAQLSAPAGLAVDFAGNLYIADAGNNRIRMMSAATGIIATVAGSGIAGYNGDNIPAASAQLNAPEGVAVDAAGNIYIADTGNRRIRVVTVSTGLIATAAGTGTQGYSGDGGPAVAAQFNNPVALAIDGQTNIYVADATLATSTSAASGRIRMVGALTGSIATLAGNGVGGYNGDGIAAADAELSLPTAVAVDGGGNIYISDSINNRIRMVSAGTDVISTVAGTGTPQYNGDNIPAMTAGIASPAGMAVDGWGNLYIADGASRIRQVQAVAGNSQLIVQGDPATIGALSFGVTVQDSTGATAVPTTYSLNVTAPMMLALPAPNPGSLGSAVVGQSYIGTVIAPGGTPPFAWEVNFNHLAANGVPFPIGDGLSVVSTGTNTLLVSGLPAAVGAVTFGVILRDHTGAAPVSATYTIDVVSSPGYQVSGQIDLSNCGSPAQGIAVSIDTSPAQMTTTGSNGQFTFDNIPNGTYTITPASNAASSFFYPATQTIVINGNDSGGNNFTASLGYTVYGSETYGGVQGGRVYLELVNNNCAMSPIGISYTGGGFHIRGVPPGSYTLQGWMDTLGQGAPNASNPVGVYASVTVTNANVLGVPILLSDPAPVALSAPPTITWGGAFNAGAMLGYSGIMGVNGEEQASSYTVQWSTSTTFASIAGSHTFVAAGGAAGSVWILNGLTNRAAYYFRAQGITASSVSAWSAPYGPIAIGAQTGGNSVTGTVSFSIDFDAGPLYVGYYDQIEGIAYITRTTGAPVSPQPYTLLVPDSSNYIPFAVMDRSRNGLGNAGNFSNMAGAGAIATSGAGAIAITQNTSDSFTMPDAGAIAVTTKHVRQTNLSGTNDSYDLSFYLSAPDLQPWAVTLNSGPNVLSPVDIGVCNSCENVPYSYWAPLGSAVPNVGDTYAFTVTLPNPAATYYETLTASVSNVLNAFAANLSPVTGISSSTTPTFTWNPPANAGNYTYQFAMWDANGNTVWEIPGNNSGSSGFSAAITSIAWGIDPTGANNPPAIPGLSATMSYTWAITAVDSDGNSSQIQTGYAPGGGF